MVSPFLSAQTKIKHRLTQEEKTLMPTYLQTAKATTAAPTGPVRNIAEFEHMEGVLIAYPFGISVSIIKEMAEDVKVTTIVANASQESTVRNTYTSGGVNLNNCNFVYAASDSYWTRDYGPWFITDGNGKVGIVDFTYNRPRPNDDAIPQVMSTFLSVPYYSMSLTQTGGNYMTDGWGISVSTDLVLDENSSLTQAQINTIMANYLGITTYHITADPLGDYIKHVDCWGKYLGVDKILIARVPTSNSQYSDYESVATYFTNQTSSYGNKYRVSRVYESNGEPYTNSVILNKKVLVPISSTSNDSAAISTYQTAMPGYEVLGFTGSWQSTDALHCRAIGIADRGLLYIKHLPLMGEKPVQSTYTISADIIAYSGQAILSDQVKVYYKVNSGSYTSVTMTKGSGNTYQASIPGQTQGSTISYYIHAADASGRVMDHPYIGSPDPHVFTVGAASSAPVAQFASNKTTVAIGGTVQFTDQSTGSPTSWSWTFDGGTPNTSTAQNPLITYNTVGTYTVSLTATNASGSDSETKTAYITVTSVTYCASKSNNYSSEYIKSVKFGSVTKTSTGSYYSDFTSTVFNMTRGASVSFTLTPGFASTSYTEYWKVWIDYNKDSDFADTGEQIYAGSGKTAKTSSFKVSSSASTGATRMRVSMKYGATPTYCETFSYGEVEDYSANIQ